MGGDQNRHSQHHVLTGHFLLALATRSFCSSACVDADNHSYEARKVRGKWKFTEVVIVLESANHLTNRSS
jgi:hypothetical protein